MDLVHEQQRLLAPPAMLLGEGKDLLEVRDSGKDRRNRFEPHPHSIRQKAGDRRLAGARRPPEDDRGKPARRHHAADRAIGTGQMFLSHHVAQRARAQPVGQRGDVRQIGGARVIGSKKIGHRDRYRDREPIREQGWNAVPFPGRAGG